jgi:hypothetical protein
MNDIVTIEIQEVNETISLVVDEVLENITINIDEVLENINIEVQEVGLKGDKGETGLSAYELAVDNGFNGTLEEYLESNAFVWASTNW